MNVPILDRLLGNRRSEQRVTRFLSTALLEPAEADVVWLAEAAAQGDSDHARWELRYARLVLAQLTAERDALDDRTASEVAEGVRDAIDHDPRIAADARGLAATQYGDRLSAYREALTRRGGDVGSGERLGRVLLAFASNGARSAGAPLARAVQLLSGYLAEVNGALRESYGTASLPEHLPPSEAR
ncbi:MAG: hypothetical protein K2X99_01495 [Gemmatimonadaceae bacterium]|nr:hypothetical protein [Gemmatimonadaceae bacterium]